MREWNLEPSSRLGIACALLLLLPTSSRGQTPVWTNRYSAGSIDRATAIALDSGGNAYVTGYSDTVSFGPGYLTIAYSKSGIPLWTNRYNGLGNYAARPSAIAVVGTNVLVTGYATSAYSIDGYTTIAYSTAGTPLWTNWYQGPGLGGRATAIAADTNGNVFVTGYSMAYSGQYDFATVAYSKLGIPLWTNRYSGRSGINGSDYARAIAVDSAGHVFVTGRADNTIGGVMNYDFATLAYSTAGLPLWTNNWSGSSLEGAEAMAVDKDGNVVVTGTSGGNFATIKYSSVGHVLWSSIYSGPANDESKGVAIDIAGNVFVTGNSQGTNGQPEFATLAYSSGGTPLWTNRYSATGTNINIPYAIAVSARGNVYVAGQAYGFTTVAYSNSGMPLWTNRFPGYTYDSDDTANALAVDGEDNVFVTGFFQPVGSSDDYATLKYSRPSLSIRETPNSIVVSWPSFSPGFLLQQNFDLHAVSGWIDCTNVVNDDGTNKTVTASRSAPAKFFRLKW